MTDYGFVLLSEFARRDAVHPAAEPSLALSARDLADTTTVPLPTVSKLLKLLSAQGLLTSQRGSAGGYRLTRPPSEITAEQILTALEGPLAITECSQTKHECILNNECTTRPHWMQLNHTINTALSGMTLAQLAQPTRPAKTLVSLGNGLTLKPIASERSQQGIS